MAVDVAPRNRRVYSAEELQRLRNSSCPQLRLDEAIEEHGQGDAETVKGEQGFHNPLLLPT